MLEGLGGLTNLGGIFKQVKTIQENLQKAQDELREKTVEADSGGGLVHVVVSGDGRLLNIKIDPSVLQDQDVEMLEDLVTSAVAAGHQKSKDLMKAQLGEATGGLDLGGLGSLLGGGLGGGQ
jgi:hypothetical protein